MTGESECKEKSVEQDPIILAGGPSESSFLTKTSELAGTIIAGGSGRVVVTAIGVNSQRGEHFSSDRK